MLAGSGIQIPLTFRLSDLLLAIDAFADDPAFGKYYGVDLGELREVAIKAVLKVLEEEYLHEGTEEDPEAVSVTKNAVAVLKRFPYVVLAIERPYYGYQAYEGWDSNDEKKLREGLSNFAGSAVGTAAGIATASLVGAFTLTAPIATVIAVGMAPIAAGVIFGYAASKIVDELMKQTEPAVAVAAP